MLSVHYSRYLRIAIAMLIGLLGLSFFLFGSLDTYAYHHNSHHYNHSNNYDHITHEVYKDVYNYYTNKYHYEHHKNYDTHKKK